LKLSKELLPSFVFIVLVELFGAVHLFDVLLESVQLYVTLLQEESYLFQFVVLTAAVVLEGQVFGRVTAELA
jgi:hypothetical protein